MLRVHAKVSGWQSHWLRTAVSPLQVAGAVPSAVRALEPRTPIVRMESIG